MTLSYNDHLSAAGLDKWFKQLNATNAPVPRQNLATILRFFQMHMPRLSTENAVSMINAMDLSRPVRQVQLQTGEELVAFRIGNESQFKLFYARPGASKYNLGVNPAGRSIVRYRVRMPAPALEAYTTGAIDFWTQTQAGQVTTVVPRANTTGVMAFGGDVQLMVPRSFSCLEVIQT